MNRTKTLVAVIVVLVIVLVDSGVKRATCALYGYQTERQVKYAAFVGCLVETPSGWTPKAQFVTTQ